MSIPGSVRVAIIAVLGLVAAAALGLAASRLAAQHIGLAAEPLSAGDRLAPSVVLHHPARPRRATRHRTAPKTSSAAPPATAPAPAPAPSLPPATPQPPQASPQPAQASPQPSSSDSGRESGEPRDD